MSLAPRVLYVDDDPVDCEMIAFWLRNDGGYDVSAALDGKRALDLMGTEFFDLFVLDYCLPDMTATTLCEHIRRQNPLAPIVIYSALDRPVDKQRAIEGGADHYLVKPDQLEELRPLLDRLLSIGLPGRLDGIRQRIVPHGSHQKRVRSSGIV